MCLVSYVPNANGYILSSNRDEAPKRSETIMTNELYQDKHIIYPKDLKGGSWIYLSDQGTSICVLNGAFQNHERVLPYKMSRGLMMKHYFDFPDTRRFLQHFDFTNIEPFTMIIKDSNNLYEFRWDNMYKHIQVLDSNKVYVWSSCTLYTPDVQLKRSSEFYRLLGSGTDLNHIQRVHLSGTVGDTALDFKMNRDNRVATISHTNVVVQSNRSKMVFQNLVKENLEPEVMAFNWEL